MRIGYGHRGSLVSRLSKTPTEYFHDFLQLHIQNKNTIKFSGEWREAETEFSRLLNILEDCFSFRNLIVLFQQLGYFSKTVDDLQSYEFSGSVQSKEFTTSHNKFHWILKYSSDEKYLVLKIYSKNRKIKITSKTFNTISWLSHAMSTRFEENLSERTNPFFDDYMLELLAGIDFTIEEEI